MHEAYKGKYEYKTYAINKDKCVETFSWYFCTREIM